MEKKQQSSVFQVFILKNKLKKTEIAQYLGVSNAFIILSVTQEVAGSSPVHTASLRIKQLAEILRLFHCSVKVFSI